MHTHHTNVHSRENIQKGTMHICAERERKKGRERKRESEGKGQRERERESTNVHSRENIQNVHTFSEDTARALIRPYTHARTHARTHTHTHKCTLTFKSAQEHMKGVAVLLAFVIQRCVLFIHRHQHTHTHTHTHTRTHTHTHTLFPIHC